MQRARLILFGLLIGCHTRFVGSAHIDAATCAGKCAQDQLTMAGIVHMGEYSSACVCEVPRPANAPTTAPTTAMAAGAMGASVGVIMQMRRQQSQQPQQPQQPQYPRPTVPGRH